MFRSIRSCASSRGQVLDRMATFLAPIGGATSGRTMVTRRSLRWLPLILALPACRPAGPHGNRRSVDAPAPSEGTSNTAAVLSDYVMKSPEFTVLIEPREPGGPGFGGTNMSMAGKPVWPPSGPSCEALELCCEQRLTEYDRFELLCPFAVIRHPGDCAAALAKVQQIGAELGRPTQGACQP